MTDLLCCPALDPLSSVRSRAWKSGSRMGRRRTAKASLRSSRSLSAPCPSEAQRHDGVSNQIGSFGTISNSNQSVMPDRSWPRRTKDQEGGLRCQPALQPPLRMEGLQSMARRVERMAVLVATTAALSHSPVSAQMPIISPNLMNGFIGANAMQAAAKPRPVRVHRLQLRLSAHVSHRRVRLRAARRVDPLCPRPRRHAQGGGHVRCAHRSRSGPTEGRDRQG